MRNWVKITLCCLAALTVGTISAYSQNNDCNCPSVAVEKYRAEILGLANSMQESASEQCRDTTFMAVGINLLWAGIATPNLNFEFPVSDHFSVGLYAGLKPGPDAGVLSWPRWSPFDKDRENPVKWAHLAVLPYARWWSNETFDGFFVEGDLMYAHYNIASIRMPFGIYPNIAKYRMQGDFYGIGASVGYSIWLTRHLNLVLSAGALGGYRYATLYECPWCGTEIGKSNGLSVAPKLDVSIAYHIFRTKHSEK